MARSTIFILMLFVPLSLNPVLAATECDRGQYMKQSNNNTRHCLNCENGSYMSERNHNYPSCFPCSQITDPSMETLITACNTTHDTDIGCKERFFRVNGTSETPGSCRKCQECTHPLYTSRNCSKHFDAVCCPGENYDVSLKEGIPKCSIYCVKGQHLDRSLNSCVPCSDNSYMDVEKHELYDCKLCNKVEVASEKIVQPCNATHQTQIGCIDGYYLHVLTHNDHHCNRCTDCQYEVNKYIGRNCTKNIDTVCCTYPNMSVINGDNGNVCVNNSSTAMPPTTLSQMKVRCKENQYLNTSSEKCLPCPDQMYVKEANHSYTSCNNCSDHNGTSLPSNCSSARRSHTLSTGNISAIVIVIVIVIALVLALVFIYLYRRCKNCRNHNISNGANAAENGQFSSNQSNHAPEDIGLRPILAAGSTATPANNVHNTLQPEGEPLLPHNPHQVPAGDEDLEGSSTTPTGEKGPGSDSTSGPDDKNSPQLPTNYVDNSLEPNPAGDEDLLDNPPDKSRIHRSLSTPSLFTVSKSGNIDSALSYATLQNVDIEQPLQTPNKPALKPKKTVSYKNLSPPRVNINDV